MTCGPGLAGLLCWTVGVFCGGFFGGSCAIADSDSAKTETNETKTIKRLDLLMPETSLLKGELPTVIYLGAEGTSFTRERS